LNHYQIYDDYQGIAYGLSSRVGISVKREGRDVISEVGRTSRDSDWIGLDFVEEKRTSEPVMKLGIQI
jgi:hypothetical protein